LISPQLYATPKLGAAALDLATLAERAAVLVPHGQVAGVSVYRPNQASVGISAGKDHLTGKPYDLSFNELFLDPWTGKELGRRQCCDISEGVVNLMPFIYSLHASLKLGPTGIWILGVVALLWTLDCFFAFYLTLPVASDRFWLRWRPSWVIKLRAGFYSFNFLLHRASGLWLWPILFIFAWSSVMFNLRPVYETVTHALFRYSTPMHYSMSTTPTHSEDQLPKLDWRAAEATGEHLIAEQASRHSFTVLRPLSISYDPSSGSYMYAVKSNLDVDNTRGGVTVMFNGDNGALQSLELPVGQHSGNTISAWLSVLHLGNVFGLPYRIFVCVLGFAIAMLSVTGVYIWWKKGKIRSVANQNLRALADRIAVASQDSMTTTKV